MPSYDLSFIYFVPVLFANNSTFEVNMRPPGLNFEPEKIIIRSVQYYFNGNEKNFGNTLVTSSANNLSFPFMEAEGNQMLDLTFNITTAVGPTTFYLTDYSQTPDTDRLGNMIICFEFVKKKKN